MQEQEVELAKAIRDIEIDSKGDIYVIVDDEKSALWKITNQ